MDERPAAFFGDFKLGARISDMASRGAKYAPLDQAMPVPPSGSLAVEDLNLLRGGLPGETEEERKKRLGEINNGFESLAVKSLFGPRGGMPGGGY